VLRAEGIHKRYRTGPPVLAGVDLALDPGAPVVLAGANGSGKSTLLRIVAGCAAPSAGRVRDRPRVVGYLPDRFPAQLRMPADVYLRHLAAMRGVAPEPELLEAFGFTGPRGEPMARLSKGNAQKVGLAQALGGGPGLVVLDEPWAGLDVEAAATLLDLLAGLEVPLLVTDHTGRAARIPGARHLRLTDGRLAPDPAAPRDSPADITGPGAADLDDPAAATGPVVVEPMLLVLAAPDPTAAAAALAAHCRVEAGLLRVVLPRAEVDSVLLTALRSGCSVVSVGPA
jgi:ABC-2 type transport system ATP-binding protein